MNFELSKSGSVKYCPSVVDIIDESLDSYIVGCYQLVGEGEDSGLSDEQLTNINQRLGCLVYIDCSIVKFEFDCLDGGVFDLKVIRLSQSTNYPKCWTAHSNGTIACYQLINETIVLIQRIPTGCSMLCSLAVCNPINDLIIVGDSDSKVIAVKRDKLIADCKIANSSGDPVWCLNSIQCDTNTFLVFSGSEDSQLRLNLFQSESFSPTLMTIKDFTAGVTSIAIIKNPDGNNHNSDYIVYVGSYDETIRVYRIEICIGEGDARLITKESIKLTTLRSIHITDSGIWKLIPIKSDQKWPFILTASMYAGAHIVHNQIISSTIKISQSLSADKHDNQNDTHLIYGVSGTINCNQLIVTSFYDKSFHIFRRCF